jgi:HK97 family phage portal protein
MNFIKKIFRRAFGTYVNISRSESSGNYNSDEEIINSIADRIATQVSKLQPQVIRKNLNGTVIKNDKLAKLLALRPSPEYNTADWLYHITYNAIQTGDGFAVIFYNKDFTEIESIKPLTCTYYRIFEDNGNLFFRYTWAFDQKEYTVPYQCVIHLKDRPGKKRFLGTSPYNDLKSSIDMLNTTYDGIKNVVKNSAQLRGYLKFNNFIDDDELKAKITEFQDAYMKAENEGGIAGIGSEWEFKELSQSPKQIPTSQLTFFRGNIYSYFGVSEKIINGEYSENEWNAFYETKIEPIAMKLSLEFTFKVFTEREREFGNKVAFVANKLQYASTTTKLAVMKDLFDRGMITINQGLEIMDMPNIGPDGDVRMISLNYVKVTDQSQYQIGEGGDNNATE